MNNLCLLLLLMMASCNRFNPKIAEQGKYSGGWNYGTDKPIQPNLYFFGDYTVVTGVDTGGNASIGLYFADKEIYTSHFQDGGYDTVVKANLNNDGIPDFLVSYAYEDGADLGAIISKSKLEYYEELIGEDYWGIYCEIIGDTLSLIQFPTVEDVNHDGKNEVVTRRALIGTKLIATSCTDTLYLVK